MAVFEVIFYAIFGTAATAIGIGVLYMLAEIIIKGKVSEDELPRKKIAIILAVSALLFGYYQFVEVPRIPTSRSIYDLSYGGIVSTIFTGLAVFVISMIGYVILLSIINMISEKFLNINLFGHTRFIAIFGLFVGSLLVISFFFGPNDVGGKFSKDRYITRVEMNLFPENSSAKNYRLPADIIVTGGNMMSIDSEEIYIDKVYWPNGGYLYAEDINFENRFTGYFYDQEGRYWDFEIVPE